MSLSIKRWRQVVSAVGIVALTAVPSFATDVWLVAKPLTKALPGPTNVPMWGFALATTNFVSVGAATVPGPTITLAPTDATPLTIHLRNDITTHPVSIVIPGLRTTTALSPVRFTDPQSRMRVKSFTAEAAPSGGIQTYTFTTRPGTFLYQSGAHPSIEVPMGLYGAVKKNATATTAYTGVTVDNEAVLLFSEIDPALNAAVTGGTFGTPAYPGSINYLPTFFLINGNPYPTAAPVLAHPAVAGERILLRLLNAGLKTHIPAAQNQRMQVVAEDGNPYPYQRDQYEVQLPASKTSDAVMIVSTAATVPVYDRALALTNAGGTGGGMLTNVAVTAVPTTSMFQQGLGGSPTNSANIDTHLLRTSANSNYGTTTNLFVGNAGSSTTTYRSILEFNLGSIPPGATVTGCTLTLNVNQRTSPTAGHIRRLCGEHWIDGNAQSETQATWNRWRSASPTAWGTAGAGSTAACSAGGDYTLADEVAYTAPAANGFFTFPSMTALCQDAITNRSGWLRLRINQDNESTSNHNFRYASSDNGTQANRPKLSITWINGAPPTTTTSTSTTSTSSTSSSTAVASTTTSTTVASTTTSTAIASTTSSTSTTVTTTTSAPGTTTTTTVPSGSGTAAYQAGVSGPAGSANVDTYLRLSTATSNWGTDTELIVGVTNAADKVYRSLLAFKLVGVPSNATVTSCTLRVSITQRTSPTAGHIRRICAQHWLDGDGQSETQATWNNWKTGSAWGSAGAASTAACASGGDYTTLQEVAYTPPTGTGLFTFPSLIALCQDAVANQGGWLRLRISQDAEATQSNLIKFDSSDAGTAANRPRLSISWTVP